MLRRYATLSLVLVAPLALAFSPGIAQGQTRAIVVNPDVLMVAEDGGMETYRVWLSELPTGEVTVALSTDMDHVKLSKTSLTFTTSNWSTGQPVMVTGVDDGLENDPDRERFINHTASGGGYDGVTRSVAVTLLDDDEKGVEVSSETLMVTEAATPSKTVGYTVELGTQPVGGDVKVAIGGSIGGTVEIDKNELTFDLNNWHMPQTVMVTAVDDEVDNVSDRVATITHTASGADYGGAPAVSVTVTVTDDDIRGLTADPTEVTVAEMGGEEIYMIRLNSEPTAPVTITPTSSEVDAATASPSSLMFTPGNWNTPQEVTVTGVNDDRDNPGDQRSATITHDAAGGDYDLLASEVAPVKVTVTDDDTVGVTVSEQRVEVDEDEGTVRYTLVLDTIPDGNVTIQPSSDMTSAIRLAQGVVVSFGPRDWNVKKQVRVTGVNDDIDNDGDQRMATISHVISSSSSSDYLNVTIDDVTAIAKDDDTAAIVLDPPMVDVPEDSGTVTYTVRLDSQPVGGATVTLTTADNTRALVDPVMLSFTEANWRSPRTVTVTGVNDDIDNDPDRTVNIEHDATGGGRYTEATLDSQSVTVIDDDVRGIVLSEQTLGVTEAMGDRHEMTYTVVLKTEPTENVTVLPVVTPPAATTDGPVMFTPANWRTPQTVTVTGMDDDVDNRDDRRVAKITHQFTGSDYQTPGVPDQPEITVTVTDDDTRGVMIDPRSVTVEETAGTGNTETYEVSLLSAPDPSAPGGGTVTITPRSSDTGIARVSGPLTFTTANWNTRQQITVIGTDDEVDNANDRRGTIITNMVSGSDYGSTTAADVEVTVTDDDTRGVVVSKDTLRVDEHGRPPGGEGTYTIKLATRPTGTVTVTPSSGALDVATVRPDSLVFTTGNWRTEQTVTVTGVDDRIDNNPERTATISHRVAGGDYGGTVVANVVVTAADDDDLGVRISPATLTVDENGGEGEYTIVLGSEPSGPVVVTPESDDETIATVESDAAVTFTAANWDIAQTVTVKGVDDRVDNDPDRETDITHRVTGADPDYRGITVAEVTVTAKDNDDKGIVTSVSEITVTEASGTGRESIYTVRLNTRPTGNVTVTLRSGDTDAATVSPPTLTFTDSNWITAQNVTVTGVDEAVDNDPDRVAMITHMASGADYGDAPAVSVAVTVTDDDNRGVTVSTGAVMVAEASGARNNMATYTIELQSAPARGETVTITPSTADPMVATVSGPLMFTDANWNTAQPVTVTGVQDSVDNDPLRTVVLSHNVEGADYDGTEAASVTVTVEDDDERGLTPSLSAVTVTEASGTGRTTMYTVRLASQPDGESVTVAIGSEEPDDATVAPASLTFTMANWEQPRTVRVTGVDDNVDNDSDRTTSIAYSFTGADYAGLTVAKTGVTVTDDDTRGVNISTGEVTVTEASGAGNVATYTVALNSAPPDGETVTIRPESDDATVATVTPSMLIFTDANWRDAQTVTVRGVNDEVDNPGDLRMASIDHGVSGADYEGFEAASVTTRVIDEDTSGVMISMLSGDVAERDGTQTYTVVLETRPETGTVTVTPESGDVTVARVTPASLTFTADDWSEVRTVTVTGVNDHIDNANDLRETEITHGVTGTGFGTINPAPVAVRVIDDDIRGVFISAATRTVPETGRDTYAIRLATQPDGGEVTVTPVSSEPGVATVLPESLVFTAGNWSTTQTVTVSGVDDDHVNPGGQRQATITHGAAGADYDNLTPAPAAVAVFVRDDDATGLTASAERLEVPEAGGEGTYTLRLDSIPNGAVTITPGSDSPDVATVEPESLVFTSSTWDQPQTVTVTAVDDEIDNDPLRTAIINHLVSGSSDYADIPAVQVTVVALDDDAAGVAIEPAMVTVAEAGGTATYTVALTSEPTGAVAIEPSSGEAGVAMVSPATLEFTAADWADPQTVTVTGVDDDIDNAEDRVATITHAVSGPADYTGVVAGDVTVTAENDDGIGLTVDPETIEAPETGGTVTYTVVLDSEPTGPVTVTLASSEPARATVAPEEMQFTADDWDVAQTATVTVAAPEDIDDPSDRKTVLNHVAAGGGYDDVTASVELETSDVRQRQVRANEQVLPHLAHAMASSALSAVTGRIDSLGSLGSAPAVTSSLNGRSNAFQALKANERSLVEGTRDIEDVLTGSSFVLRVGLDTEREGAGPQVGDIAIWGSGDYRRFSQWEDEEESGFGWNGGLSSYHLGTDTWIERDILMGVSVSRSTGSFSYTDSSGPVPVEGKLASRMTSVHPYVNWKPAGRSGVWLTVGYGRGEIDLDEGNARNAVTTSAELRSMATGLTAGLLASDSLIAGGETTLDLKADLALAEVLITGEGPIEPFTAPVNRKRVTVEMRHQREIGSSGLLTPAIELGLRRRDGEGATGASWEVGGALNYVDMEWGLTVSGRARVFTAVDSGYREWGVGGLVRLEPDSAGRGLALSLAPGWGDTEIGALSPEEARLSGLTKDLREPEGRLAAELAYGLPGSTGGRDITLTPYSGFTLTGADSRRYRLGGRMEITEGGRRLGLGIEGDRSERGTAPPGHGVTFRFRTDW